MIKPDVVSSILIKHSYQGEASAYLELTGSSEPDPDLIPLFFYLPNFSE
jgi:hypothetical protein